MTRAVVRYGEFNDPKLGHRIGYAAEGQIKPEGLRDALRHDARRQVHRERRDPDQHRGGARRRQGKREGRIIEVVDRPSDFSSPAPEATIQAVAAALRANNIEARVVDTGEDARRMVLELVPEGAEFYSGKSKTLHDVGLLAELDSGPYDSVRGRYMKMDRQTESREIRKLMASPDYMLGSVQAVTEDGDLVVASASASQLGAYASGAGRLILVVGSQKIVRGLDEALRRIEQHVLPYEDAIVRERMNISTFLGKLLIIRREWVDGRTTVILVREPVGV